MYSPQGFLRGTFFAMKNRGFFFMRIVSLVSE